MEERKCIYLEIAMEKSKRVDHTKGCLLHSFCQLLGISAAKGKCEKCKMNVGVGSFAGPSVGSLTENNDKED